MPDITNMQVAMYLRKSRDEEQSGTLEVLARHREILMVLVAKHQLVLVDVFEEVVSGESLYVRPQMLKMLESIEANKYDAILCVDIDRLGRGNMSNQGVIIEALKWSNTCIITPHEVYDLTNDTDEQQVEIKAFLSRQEYRSIRARLTRGLHYTIQRGGYIANAPYGYRRTTINKIPSLEIYEPEAKFVRFMYELYCQGIGSYVISHKLNSVGAPLPHRSAAWSASSVRYILCNPVFIGKVVWNRVQHIKKGKRGNDKHIMIQNDPDKWFVYDGLHAPIITQEQFDKAQDIRAGRYHPSKQDGTIKNPLASIIQCANCGKNMQHNFSNGSLPYLLCPRKGCMVSSKYAFVEEAILSMLSEQLSVLNAEIIASENVITPDYAEILQSITESINRTTSQKSRLYDLLEQGIYDVVTYQLRMRELTDKIAHLESQYRSLSQEEARVSRRNKLLLRDRIVRVLDIYDSTDAAGKNALLRSVISKVIYNKEKGAKPHGFELDIQYNYSYLYGE